MSSSSSRSLLKIPPFGIRKNARLEAGKTPSQETGNPSKRIARNQGIDTGKEVELEDEFDSIAQRL